MTAVEQISLPRVPSALLRLALDDLAKCEADDRYEINMGLFHCPERHTCSVCLAGAVIAQTLGVDTRLDTCPRDFGVATSKALYALDALRNYSVHFALKCLNIKRSDQECLDIQRGAYQVSYGEDKVLFRENMNVLADNLERAGL